MDGVFVLGECEFEGFFGGGSGSGSGRCFIW